MQGKFNPYSPIMKYTLISAVFVSVFLLSAHQGQAQLKGFSFGPYLEAAWPRGNFANTHNTGIGAGGTANIRLGGHLSAIGSYGFLHFGKTSSGGDGNIYTVDATALRLGIKYRLPLVYLKLESGTATLSHDHGSAVILSPGVGARLLGLDVQASYETWLKNENLSFTSLKVAYHF